MTEDMPIKKMKLERMITMLLQRFQLETGAKVRSVHVDVYDAPNNAGEEQNVVAKASIVLK